MSGHACGVSKHTGVGKEGGGLIFDHSAEGAISKLCDYGVLSHTPQRAE